MQFEMKDAGKSRRPRAMLNYGTNVVLYIAGAIVFATGLVLLTKFHMGEGSLRGAAAGLSRLAWVNLHRLSAAAILPGLVVHVIIHWRIIVTRMRRTLAGLPGKARAADLVLYCGFAAVLLEGCIAWWILPGSPPLYGPAGVVHMESARHLCIDLHNFSGIGLLPAAAFHAFRHMDWMLRQG